ncbi:hypothetical protein E0W68_05830 [Flavobacterium salilacus subsp. salilacus]|uniref:LIC_10190 family membrane protein n=1 Tax=Flavobacterium TaxID=237 RepID=UPI0010756225|nr:MULTISPECIES: hypothetical protein [Flavobacterium]KAF2519284.1 hypothetical protein E0W68_05830 [Flavobacterium salilacus subsp. salilacus]MBE1613471.1 hypothetical protein [Flavobacterium sp. SaA2.13]
MILILAYWLFLFFLILPFGVVLQKGIKLKTTRACITVLLGLLFLTVSFTITALFVPLGANSFLCYIFLSVLLYFFYRKELNEILSTFYKDLQSLTLFHKSIIILLLLGAALKSAQLPFVIDNESYYIQTIKWINQYGLVKGLGNLHIYLAQTSPWHILHAGLNLNFLGITFNDLNGFLFIICMLYCITESKNKDGWFSLLPVFSTVYFLFLDAPSPDLPVLIIIPVILYLYTEKKSEDDFKVSLLLLAFIAFIKVTIAPLALLFLFKLSTQKKRFFFIKTAVVFAVIWMVKNTIVSGYPLYPFTNIAADNDWVVPQAITDSMGAIAHKDVYGVGTDAPFIQKIASWLQMEGIKGILNKLIVILFLLLPNFRIIRRNKSYRAVYIVFLVHFVILLFTSPQYRFFLPEMIFFLLFIGNEIMSYVQSRVFNKIVMLGGALAAFVLFFNFSFISITPNKFHQSRSGFQLSQLYRPEPVTRYPEMKFIQKQMGNLEYYSPETNFFIFGTADGSLPCINEAQINYFERKTGYIPQLRGESLEDGFISEKTLRE